MTIPKRIGAALLFAALLGAGASSAAASSWTESFFLQDGRRSPLDSLPPTGLPPAWEYVPAGASDPANPSHRSTSVSVDPLRGTVRESHRQGDVEVGQPFVADLEGYDAVMGRRTTDRVWLAVTRGNRSTLRTTAARSGGLFRVDIPVTLPKALRSIVGDGSPNLLVSGSETITLGGTSEWTSRKSDVETKGQSKFPSLEMKQELNVNLTGSIGDKIKVDVDQSSNVRTNLDNKVKLRYEGGDDDMVKLVELGNTNLSVAGASFRQDGLFGVKTIMKLGTVDLTAIASKQEGKTETSRFTPSGEKRTVQVDDLGYIQRRYYIISDHAMNWQRGSLVVYKDDRIPSNNTTFNVLGLARVDPEAPFDSLAEKYYRGSFNVLVPGTDYDIITPYLSDVAGTEIPVLRFRFSLQPQEIVGIAYVEGAADSIGSTDVTLVDPTVGKEAQQVLLKLIKADPEDIDRDPLTGRYDPGKPLYPVLGLEMRNFYDLQAKNIALETLSLSIRRRDYGQATNPDNVEGVPLVQMLGLDQRDRFGTPSAEPSPDGLVDDQYIDADDGILFFPDLHPFDPDTVDCASPDAPPTGFAGLLCLDNYGRNKLREQEGPYQANPNVYYFRSPNPQTDSRFYIDAEFRSSQQGYYLGQMDILEDSEQVKVDGILMAKGRDYSIDYETGQITFLRPPGPDQVVTVEYSFAPGVGQVQRTLLGASSSYVPGPNFSLTSSLLYESRGASEQNPKLGEEPAVSIVGDLASIATVRPQFMTDLANRIPGVRTNQPSTLNLQGAIALSAPNPNTAGAAYVDDMEGNKEQTLIPLTRPLWFWSSIPFDSLGNRLSRFPADHAPVRWYNPRGVKEHDLKPTLTDEEGGDNEHQVLEIDLQTPPGQTGYTPATWSGLTLNLSRLGDDYSKMRFLEIWVNDRTQDHTQTSGRLHIDFGEVEEDAFWQPDSMPNGRLDTEDINRDTRLDKDEDTGLDGIPDTAEPGYDPNTNPDPNGDDYLYNLDRPTEYGQINGTEKSSQGDVNGRPDTEDLNLNGVIDTQNDYFTTSIDLSDTMWVAIDVAKQYFGDPDVKDNNGWRLFRIPILEETFRRQGAPNWDNIKHARLWFSGLEGNASGRFNIQIGGIELVGNRWLRQAIPTALQDRGVEFEVGSRNNKDDAGIYTPPYDVENAPGGKADQREQSLAMVYRTLVPGDSVFAFRTVGDAGAAGWTQYREIRYYLHGEDGVEAQSLRLVARFGADTVSYYEYSIPVTSGWKQVVVPMDVLSQVKDARPDSERVWADSTSAAAEGAVYTVVGNPSFTRVNRITFGLTVDGQPTAPGNGEVWVDDLRLSGVRRDKGVAGNLVVQASFADVLALNVGYDSRDADFFRVGAGGNRGSGFDHTQWNFSGTFNLDRMVPRSGLQLPARYTYQNTVDVPKFKIGSDVVLAPDRADIETSRSSRQSFDMSYQRVGNRRGWKRYSFDALTGRGLYSRAGSVTPQSSDSGWSFSGGVNYDLPIGGGRGLGITRRFRFKFLPENIRLGSTFNSTRNVNYSRNLDTGELKLRRDDKTRMLLLSAATSWAPITALTLSGSVASDRNMLLRQEGFFGWNKGTQVRYNQRLGASFSPRGLLYLNPTLTVDGTYNESAGPEKRVQATDPEGTKDISNGATARLTLTVPLGRVTSRAGRPTSVHDTTSSWLSAPLRLLRGRVNDIQATFNMDRSTTIRRVVGNPGSAFKTGFTQEYDPGLLLLPGSQEANNRRFQGSANTGLKIMPTLSADIRADRSVTYQDALYGSTKTNTVNWPDITVRWTELQRLLGLTGPFTSLALNSRYTGKMDESGPSSGRVDRRTENTSWGPLLGWQASLKNNLRVDLTSNYNRFEIVDYAALGSTRVRSTTTHDLRITKLYPASKGIKFPWSRKPLRLPNDLNLTLTTSLRENTSEAVNPYGYATTELDQQVLDVQTGTTYNFTQSITGGFNAGYARTQDHKSDLTQHRINLAFNAQFRF
jgi:hypothetical protein